MKNKSTENIKKIDVSPLYRISSAMNFAKVCEKNFPKLASKIFMMCQGQIEAVANGVPAQAIIEHVDGYLERIYEEIELNQE